MGIAEKTRELCTNAVMELGKLVSEGKVDLWDVLAFVLFDEDLGLKLRAAEEGAYWAGALTSLANAHGMTVVELLKYLSIPVPQHAASVTRPCASIAR